MNRPSRSRVRVSGPRRLMRRLFREESSSAGGYFGASGRRAPESTAHSAGGWSDGPAPGELTLPLVERFVQGRRDRQRVHRESDVARDAAVAGASALDRGGCGVVEPAAALGGR